MFKRIRQRITNKVEKFQHATIEIVSIKRRVKESRDKKYFKELFNEIEKFALSESQVNAATSHAKETLVIAGAGSGKTSLLIGRAKYLIESNRAEPENILMMAFNKDAAKEINERSKALNLNIEATTFHAFGNKIIRNQKGNSKVMFSEDHEIEKFISNIVSDSKNLKLIECLREFFLYQMVPIKNFDEFKDLSEYAAFIRSSVPYTLNNERVKSHGEWLIANFLYANSIQYQYESLYEDFSAKDVHKPDFTIINNKQKIYIEYFGITKDGKTSPEINREKYHETKIWKRNIHKKNGTTLIELTFQDLLDGNLLKKLELELSKLKVKHKRVSDIDLLEAANQVGYQTKFNKLLGVFLKHVRSQNLSNSEIENRAANSKRSIVFLDIFKLVRNEYESLLRKHNQPDFPDLIHGAISRIEQKLVELNYSHLLIDEFQDISADRNMLIESIKSAIPDIETTYVGDDWQSIYSFAGSDISIMRKASRPKMNRKVVALKETYRMPQIIASASSQFVMKNDSQIEKKIESIHDKVNSLNFYWDIAENDPDLAIEALIKKLGNICNNKNLDLYVLARYSNNLPSKKLVDKLWKGPVTISTIHKAKGLEADYVILMDLKQDNRGFPSTIIDDPILKLVLPEKEDFKYAEERRLFYVALTRAKIACHVISPLNEPSIFALELYEDGIGNHFGKGESIKCPVCNSGYLITNLKYESIGCSNSPLCSFKTPTCSECNKYTNLISLKPVKYVCKNHKNIKINNCERCAFGAYVKRSYRNKIGKKEFFYSCHMWSINRCSSTKNDI
jgi:DNA helicase-4